VLLENRIEILKQAALALASSLSDSFRLGNRETVDFRATIPRLRRKTLQPHFRFGLGISR
jgi:hypothetical protein